jgi:hypothetical protein
MDKLMRAEFATKGKPGQLPALIAPVQKIKLKGNVKGFESGKPIKITAS